MVRYNVLKGLYDIEKKIGSGGFAKVKLATHLATGDKVAIKIMDKALLGDDLPRVKLELKALKSLSHEHICQLYQVIEIETHFFIIMEYCSGGELFDHIVEKNRLTETESRMFFRQIVSAVAYLHSLGYAHRDLKPENVLLDKDQNLKLIDFGLCARPEGGMSSPLFTSCGSPTYAAPELVLGKQYLGPEVDVWAMGVLLYALLVGSLPFDDMNIDGLYKKILNGKYEEPCFMSKGSKELIKSMLQVDAKKRITVNELLSHPWLTLNILEPVRCLSKSKTKYDAECINILAKQCQISNEDLWTYLKRWKYDYLTATYLLLLAKKKRGLSLKLDLIGTSFSFPKQTSDFPSNTRSKPLGIAESSKLNNSHTNTTHKIPLIEFNHENSPKFNGTFSPGNEFLEPQRPTNIRKPLKRFRSPTLDGECSPIPAKKFTPLKEVYKTPENKQITINSMTPNSTRRVLGSLERSLHKVRYALKPKKPSTETGIQPVFLTTKNLSNVSTTQCSDPEYVINALLKALEEKGISCKRKGYILRGKMEPNIIHRYGGCSFELEICYLPSILRTPNAGITPTRSILKNGTMNCTTPTPGGESNTSTPMSSRKVKDNKYIENNGNSMNFVGIRRKRLKGDSWCYKKVCEEVLALTATEFRHVITESSV